MKIKLPIVSILFLLALSIANPTFAAEQLDIETKSIYVTAVDGLNIRTGPGLEYDRIDCVPYGTELQKLDYGMEETWSAILFNDDIFYVYNDYTSYKKIEDFQPKTSTFTTEQYSASTFKKLGVIYYGGYRWTWYSEKVLPGGGLNIPGRHSDSNNYICDENDYICLASNDLSKGAIVNTPFGKQGKIYDCGCDSGTLDVYVSW